MFRGSGEGIDETRSGKIERMRNHRFVAEQAKRVEGVAAGATFLLTYLGADALINGGPYYADPYFLTALGTLAAGVSQNVRADNHTILAEELRVELGIAAETKQDRPQPPFAT